MSKSIAGKMLVVGILAVFAAGCATMRGPSDEELIQNTLNGWKAALENQDIDAMMAFYSEDFTTDRGNTKEELREFFQGAKDQGYLEGAQADLSAAETTIEDGTAEVGPIYLSSDAGSLDTTLFLKKEEDGVWRIVGSEMSQ